MLDLGVWMSIQSRVEKLHHMKRCQHDALAKSAETAWESCLDQGAFSRVFKRLRVTLTCIVDDKGGRNEKVEEKCGVLCRDATIADLTNDDEDEDDMNIIEIEAVLDDEDDLGSVASLDQSKIGSATSTTSSFFFKK